MKRRMFLGMLVPVVMAPSGILSQQNPDFSGNWKQSNERSTPRRTGNVMLHISHQEQELTVETTTSSAKHAIQRYTTDGKVSVSTGADGDEFHTSIVWNGQSLIFSVEEHEDGHILLSKETWTLIENGAALERVREPLNALAEKTGRQTLIYLRESSASLK